MIPNRNEIEAERSIGRIILYGQPIQLLHLKTNKYLTVARESAEMQKDCMRLTLDEEGNSNSIFYIQPYYKFRNEGQKVLIFDQVRFWNRKSNLYINLSKYTLNNDINRREVNMSTDSKSAKWRMRLFTPFLGPEIAKSLKVGDVIRLYHKEAEGYLSVNSKTHAIKINSKRNGDFDSNSSNTMWEVEQFDPSRGGCLIWNDMCRLKHMASNKYMGVRILVVHDNDSDSSEEEDNDPSTVRNSKSTDKLQEQIDSESDHETLAGYDSTSSTRDTDDGYSGREDDLSSRGSSKQMSSGDRKSVV